MAAIEINNLQKKYNTGFFKTKTKWGLKNLSLEVREGEVFGYLGPNGAGKTTTLKILMGLVSATGGTARILGRDLEDPELKREIGFLPEQPYFYDQLTARELLEYYGHLSGMPSGSLRRRALEMLDRVGIADAADVQLRKFSKGMLQRVGIAQAILHDPKLLFLDEPMSGLDPIGRREVRELIVELHGEGKTIFFSTHILADAEAICDRVAILHQGELKGIGVVADLKAKSLGKSEIIWESEGEVQPVQRMSEAYRRAGSTVRAVIGQEKVNDALAAIQQAGGRLISVNPIRGGLEEYFLEHVEAAVVERP
jgi:ABC-2 type transport system ATP-binding protein